MSCSCWPLQGEKGLPEEGGSGPQVQVASSPTHITSVAPSGCAAWTSVLTCQAVPTSSGLTTVQHLLVCTCIPMSLPRTPIGPACDRCQEDGLMS